jgi:F-type H+-transporting ATPase subunit epsilon
MASIAVEIMTPERLVMQTQADSIIVPAAEGELGILSGHAPLLAQLEPGAIRLQRADGEELFAISGGFLEVANNRVEIFAETAEMAKEIDVERARQAAERARLDLKMATTDLDLAKAEAALRRAMVRLRATEGFRRTSKPGYR